MDASEDLSVNPRAETPETKTIGDLVNLRLSRRGFLAGLSATTALTVAGCASTEALAPAGETADIAPSFIFEEITRGIDETHHLPAGYEADVLIRWGDPMFSDAPAFDPLNQSSRAQKRQFGYNNDYIGYVELPARADEDARALLCVNHEYTSTQIMLPGLTGRRELTRAECEVEMAAHGGSVIEVVKRGGRWSVVEGSSYTRRITASDTLMKLTGPASGDARLKTNSDPSGTRVIGTMNNCAGGITPWGTYLMAEENFNGNFGGELPEGHREAAAYPRYGVPSGWYQWHRHFARFDLGREPNEPNRFGWVVEVDPMDPTSTPMKRTALGRFKHEGAESVVAPDGRVVIYMGDDQRFDYLYKFVSRDAVNTEDREANFGLLDHGTLYVAQFDADGGVGWLALTHGDGPLTAENGFDSQADVVIEARRAADLLGATPMDRPEDVEPDAATGRVFVMLTNNTRRTNDQLNVANPRPDNRDGHVIEIVEPDGDFAATRSSWDFLVKCGDPADAASGATWNGATTREGWFGSPDNCAVDPTGRLWISTDGNEKTGAADGVWAMEADGPLRGTSKAFFRAPVGAEVCGPKFDSRGETLFVAVQHPGDGDGATFEAPTTRWPDFGPNDPPRPSILAITKTGGGPIGA
ncbi:MAG: PhoX family phosphatase [Pseudomonadota bacterium]